MRSRHALPSTRLPVTFALALAVAVALAASGPAPCWAVLNDNTVKGAATHHVFSSSFGDSIDTLSGQLHFKIPIGPSFAVSDSFSYQLYLTYTSKVWRYHRSLPPDPADPNVPRYRLDGRGQAGVGFYLQMGRIFWKWDDGQECGSLKRRLIVQFADGTEHDVTNGVTDDLSFIRADSMGGLNDPDNPVVGYRVKTPDGVWYTMDHWVDDPAYDPASASPDCLVDGRRHNARTSDIRGWYVTKIEDLDPNGVPRWRVLIDYEPPRPGSEYRFSHLIRRITDSAGRVILMTNVDCDAAASPETGLACPADPNATSRRWLPVAYVTEVRLPAFGVADPNLPGAAVYKFSYETADTTDDLVRVPDLEDSHTLPREVFLRRVVDPASYETSFDYEDPAGTHVGVVTTRTLPTGARVEYDYANYGFAVSWTPGTPCGFNPGPRVGFSYWADPFETFGSGSCTDSSAEDMPRTTGVVRKRVRLNPDLSASFDPNAPEEEVHRWEWNRDFTNLPGTTAFALSNPWKVIEEDPFRNWTVHYFAASAGGDPNDVLFYDDATWSNGVNLGTEYFLGPGLMLLRGVYREYEDDFRPGNPNTPGSDRHYGTNRRVKATTTADYEGGSQLRRVEEKDWDYCGHHRVREEYGLDGSLYRSRRTCYNCPSDPNAIPPQGSYGLCVLPDENDLNANWILNTYTYDELLDGGGNVVSRSDFTFGPDGKMRSRIDRGSGLEAARTGGDPNGVLPGDVLTLWKFYGDPACGVYPYCPGLNPYDLSDPSRGNLALKIVDDDAVREGSDFVETYEYSDGAYLAKQRYPALSWFLQDKTWDVPAGLVSSSSDSAGVPTQFEYDKIGRLTRAVRGTTGSQDAPITISYPSVFVAEVLQQSAQDTNNSIHLRYSFDQLFRLVKEEKWSSDLGVLAKIHRYDAAGRKTFESEWGSSTAGTTFDYGYPTSPGSPSLVDPLDRVHRVTRADGSVTETTYRGLSTQVTVRGLGDPNGRFDATTIYTRDAFDRLAGVISPRERNPLQAGDSPAADAEYVYDVRDNLTEVRLLDPGDPNSLGQRRFFRYDALGRLVSSTNPENGTVVNIAFTAAGDVTSRRDAAGNVFDYVYDAARRVRTVSLTPPGGTSAQTVGEYTYDGPAATYGASGGKLVAAKSWWSPGSPFEKRFFHNGRGGRLSRIEWTFPGWGQTLASSRDYNDLGLPASFSYPGEAGAARTNLQYAYYRGYLTSITTGQGSPLIPRIVYNGADGIRSLSTSGGVITEVVPDVMYRPGQIRVTAPPPSPSIGGGGAGDGGSGGDPGGGDGGGGG